MEFPVAIPKDEGSVYAVIVPDIAGCHSWRDTIEQAIDNAREAIESHVAALIECGEELDLSVTPVEVLRHQPEYAGAVWALVDVDPAKFDTKPERVDIKSAALCPQQDRRLRWQASRKTQRVPGARRAGCDS
jgi:predicted RNase H-like HicB family nuclease